MRKRHVNPAGVLQPRSRIAQVVAVDLGGGTLLTVSGQIALDVERRLVGGGDITAQAHTVLTNIGTILASQSAGFADLVRVGVFLTDITKLGAFNAVLAEYATEPPASTAVGVASLFHPEALVEVDAQAIVTDN